MSNVRRVYVEKKPAYAVKAKELQAEIRSYLGITSVTGVRVLIRYDIENISDETYGRALETVFSEPPVDNIYEETFEYGNGHVFSVEFLPGQFDQRADSAQQCVKLLNEEENPIIHTASYLCDRKEKLQRNSLKQFRATALTRWIHEKQGWISRKLW